jgi:sterol desaturase/sphingolipid hydroxylase (fatty acid hydroxylase superfamily)
MILDFLALNAPHAPLRGSFLMVAFIFIGLEILYARLADHDEGFHHDLKETSASIMVAIGDFIIRVLTSGIAAFPFFFLYEHRIMDISMTMGTWLALFFGVEFSYYWFHRASHRVRWLWATHAVHHSATHFNLAAAVRLGWTGQLTGAFVFFLPLAWIGFHPLAITAMIGLGLLYQFFLHTAISANFGSLEWVFNTPSHHRVHHASNEACLDKNYGSILIIFDRMFGTFAGAPPESLRFGLKGHEPSNNPFRIAFGEWACLISDIRNTKGLKNRLKTIFGAP